MLDPLKPGREDQRCIVAAGIDRRMSMIKSPSFISWCFSGLAE
jgi:hypothetical protein